MSLAHAIGFVFVGDALLVGTLSLLSSYGGSMAVAQEAPSDISALAGAADALQRQAQPRPPTPRYCPRPSPSTMCLSWAALINCPAARRARAEAVK